jgi:pyruvate kinase
MSSTTTPRQAVPPAGAHTKIIATIGPASEDRVPELIRAGLSVARINFSHGAHEDARRRIGKVRGAAEAARTAVGILVDIQGPKLRMGCFAGGRRHLCAGETVTVRRGSGVAPPGEILFDFGGFLDAVRPGHRLLLADGQACLEALSVGADALQAKVRLEGEVGDRKGVHFPDSRIGYELPTAKDREDVAFARELGVDMIGVSFVSRAEEVRAVRELCPGALVIGKIERLAALENLAELLVECDGLMVARGDLGVEAELEELPLIQKTILHDALRAGRFTITATEMLESMVENSRPTRAEVTDVANAVLDGTDAVMLSAETAIGEHPVEAVRTMTRVALAVERSQRYHDLPRQSFRREDASFSNATAHAAVQAAEALGIPRIVCFTETGNTARLISRYRPSAEIIGLSPNPATVGHMTVLAHVRPILFRREASLEDMLHAASRHMLERGLAQRGDEIVFVAGVPPGVSRTTNVLKLHRIGEEIRLH